MLVQRKLFGDIGAGVGATLVLSLVGAASTIALARLLTVEQFGKVSVLLLAYNLTSTFDAVRPVTIYFAQRLTDKPRETFASIFWLDAGIGGVLGLILACAALVAPQIYFERAELLCLAGVFVLFFMQSAYWGWADAHGLVAATAMVRAFIMILVYIAFVALAAGGIGGVGYAMVLLIATASTFWAFWWICRSRNLVTTVAEPEPAILRAIGAEVRRCMQFNFATLVLATTDRIAISLFGGPRSLGLYCGHFELATKPMALARAVQSALTPHITQAAASKSDIFQTFALGTKAVFGVLSLTAWGAMLLRDWLTRILLGPEYSTYQDVFAAVVLAQCFVLLGFASALLLNSIGDFRLQKTYYLLAAAAMLLLAFPAAHLAGVFGVSIVYLVVRTVDVWLLHSALHSIGRTVVTQKALAVAAAWCGASCAAWFGNFVGSLACGSLFLAMMFGWELTQSFALQPCLWLRTNDST